MRARSVIAAMLVAAGVPCGARARVAHAEPHPSVCRVLVEERSGQAAGSGTLIDARDRFGLVITNWHVVRDAAGKIEVVFPGGHRSEARALKLDETWDLAALVVWRPPAEPVRIAARPPQPGDPLTICGYGAGDYRAATGRCQDFYSPEVGLPTELVELSVAARQGDSGGPILNARGELAGVLFGSTQGTTLGSFGPRVERFLASLAPDIGRAETQLAGRSTRHAGPRTAKPWPVGAAVDPFLVAERRAVSGAVPESPSANPRAGSELLGESLADRPSSPALAAARPRPRGEWGPSPSTPLSGLSVAATSPATAETALVDWSTDTRTLLAIAGAAAILVAAARA